MPKGGMTDREWMERLASFMEGKFQFGRGQRPPKGSKRALQLKAVESCPKQRNSSQLLNVLGRKIQCTCGFHERVSGISSIIAIVQATSLLPCSTTQSLCDLRTFSFLLSEGTVCQEIYS